MRPDPEAAAAGAATRLQARARRDVSAQPKRVAFVLSGGGSLGAIQVGMLQALFEEGIQPDLLVGTSAGAVNAAWVAGLPHRNGVEELADIWCGLRRQDIFPISPWSGARGLIGSANHVVPNAGLRAVIERHIPYERLEDAAVPIHVVATDLKNGHAVVLSSGPCVPALLASTAIPGVFPPVVIGRRELVDGGVADMTPIAAAIEQGATHVYVLPIRYAWLRQERSSAIGMALQALARVVEQRLHVEVAAHKHIADIRVLPIIDGPAVSPADFSRTAELISRAYRASKRSLSRSKEPATEKGAPTGRVVELARLGAQVA
jgi:NTE family protein